MTTRYTGSGCPAAVAVPGVSLGFALLHHLSTAGVGMPLRFALPTSAAILSRQDGPSPSGLTLCKVRHGRLCGCLIPGWQAERQAASIGDNRVQ